MTRVLGIGVGLFVLILFWVVAVFAALAACRAKKARGAFAGALAAAVIVTLILTLSPRKDAGELDKLTTATDNTVIPRVALVVVMSVCALMSLLCMCKFHWMQPTYAGKQDGDLY